MPPGAMSLTIQFVLFCFVFFLLRRECASQLDFRDHMMCFFFVTNKFNSEMQRDFLVVAIFAKTESYLPSNLLVCAMMYRTSAMYQLLTCQK